MEREYHWYVIGCDRLGQPPVTLQEFSNRWQEFEAYAEQLKAAEANRSLPELDTAKRMEMEKRVKDDPFIRALLVGMTEEGVSFS